MLTAETVKGLLVTGANVEAWLRANLGEKKFAIFSAEASCSSRDDFERICRELAERLGNPVVQNADGATIVEVYDRKAGTIEQGARYHQTRQGGDIHVDSVNGPQAFKYLILGCLAPAAIGGESILVRADDAYRQLQDFPDVLQTLQEPFWFEERGMHPGDESRLFSMPVLTIDQGTPHFRYLRSYIASAHQKSGEQLTASQLHAFDVLDAVLQYSEIQYRRRMLAGEILVTLDTEVFHGRTDFVDRKPAVGAQPDISAWSEDRRMFRMWVN